jgi:hypothetical protein
MELTNHSDTCKSKEIEYFRNLIEAGGIDYIDFGCSKGGSLEFAKKQFSGHQGMGIDIDQSKIEKTRAAGYAAVNYNINDIPDEKLVRFVVMSHFLEHVPSHLEVKAFIRKACTISKEFVYIQQPYFDADTYLFTKGFKLFWSDWSGHPNRMTSLELWLLLRDLKEEGLPITFSLHAHKKITESADPRIHPLTSSINQHDYNAEVHPPKDPSVLFEDNVFHEIVCLITLPGCDHAGMLKKLRYHRTIIDSYGNIAKSVENDHKENIVGDVRKKQPALKVNKIFEMVKIALGIGGKGA